VDVNTRDQAESGRRGGRAHSDAKRKAAITNGRKGGRPRKDGKPARRRHWGEVILRRDVSAEQWNQVVKQVWPELTRREQALMRGIRNRKDLRNPSERSQLLLVKFRWLMRRRLAELERTGSSATT